MKSATECEMSRLFGRVSASSGLWMLIWSCDLSATQVTTAAAGGAPWPLMLQGVGGRHFTVTLEKEQCWVNPFVAILLDYRNSGFELRAPLTHDAQS